MRYKVAGRYEPPVDEEVKYPEPKTIISEVMKIEEKISEGLNRLQEKLN